MMPFAWANSIYHQIFKILLQSQLLTQNFSHEKLCDLSNWMKYERWVSEQMTSVISIGLSLAYDQQMIARDYELNV